MKGQRGRQPGTEKEIVFALSVFAQFSAGQILARALGSRSSLLGFNLTPTKTKRQKENREGGGEVEDGCKRNRKLSGQWMERLKRKAGETEQRQSNDRD